jgi:predicted dehydrogenase
MSLLSWLKRPAPPSAGRFGFAVVGLGHIASYFLDALRDSPTVAVTALISGDAAKASSLAMKYGAARTYSYADFDHIAEDSRIDAVYLALPVSQHREYTQRAAAAGKHVLCEKPMAPTAADALAMIADCAAASVRLSIAYRCRFDPAHQRARDLVRHGALGETASLRIASGYGFELKPGWRTEPSLAGGGSLYDVGIYPLNASRYLLGEDPDAATYVKATTDAQGLERSIAWTNSFSSGASADCESSYVQEIPDTLRIEGEHGWLELDPAFTHRGRLHLRGSYTGADGRKVTLDEPSSKSLPSHFRLEAEHLAAVVRQGAKLITPGEDGLADMVAMEAIYAAAGVRLP